MKPEFFRDHALLPALSLLPPAMDTPPAGAMVIAICLQESALQHRAQSGGPARGYPQFEVGGLRGVLAHPASRPHAQRLLAMLDYDPASDAIAVSGAIQHNDVLAAGFARLLLWTLPDALPARGEPEQGWRRYVSAWRPGKPRRESWDGYFAAAWDLVA